MFIRLDRVLACDGRTDEQTELLYVLQLSALQAMRPRCKNSLNVKYRKIGDIYDDGFNQGHIEN